MNLNTHRQLLLSLAEPLWRATRDLDLKDPDAPNSVDMVIDRITERGTDTPFANLVLSQSLGTPDGELSIIGLTYWAHSAYPMIQLSHTYAASLLATNVSDEVVEYARPPFNAFLIEVPSGLISITDEYGKLFDVIHLLVIRLQSKKRGDTWGYIAYTAASISLWRYGVYTKDLLPGVVEGDFPPAFSFEITDHDERAASLIGRLIVNVCLAMSDPSRVKKIGRGHDKPSHGGHSRREPGEPTVRIFKVGQPVSHDMRGAVKDYLEGRRGTLKVQTIVAGHWKPKLGARLGYPVWIEPYWRGPKDAPIAFRKHEFKDD